MALTHEHRSDGGLHLYLGANVRSRDPREDKFALKLTVPRVAVDFNQPRSLADYQGRDFRVPIMNQGQLGACAAFAATNCARIARQIAGGADVALSAGWLYEKVRQFEKSFPQDAGSYPADNLDIAIAGIPREDLNAYVQDPAYLYPASMDQDAPNQAFVASHHPFYPSDGSFLADIWTALDAGLPCELAMYWTNAFFNPDGNGVLQAGQTQGQAVGGHAITAWAIVPPNNGLDGLVLCANQWTTGWNPQIAGLGYQCRPGDFAIPWSYFNVADSSTMIFEARAVSGVVINPNPQPNPDPNPNPPPTFCKDQALQAAKPVVDHFQSLLEAKPTSRTTRYRLQGAQAVQQALTSAEF